MVASAWLPVIPPTRPTPSFSWASAPQGVGFAATLTLESEPIQAEDGNDRELEVLRVPVFGNEGGGTRAKPIISHGCNCDRGRINKSSVDLCANAYACVLSRNADFRDPRFRLQNISCYPEIQLYSYIHIIILLSCFGWRQGNTW